MATRRKSYILILHPDDDRVLTLDGERLPSFWTSPFHLDMNEWNCTVQKTFDLPFQVVFLRCECGVPLPEGETHSFIYIFEIPLTEVSRIGQIGTWIVKEKVPELCKDPPILLVTEYLREYAIYGLDIHVDRLLSFSKRGWFDNTSAWSSNILSAAGFHVEELQQHTVGNGSCLLLARVQDGARFYIKGCYPKGIYNEAAATLVLGTEMPEYFAKPLAVDLERNVLLMNDVGPTICTPSEQPNSSETDERIFTTWGEAQLRSISKKERLINGGLPVWDMKALQSLLEDMFGDDEWWSHQQGSMNEEERSKYDWATCKDLFMTRVESFYSRIAQYRVPFSLVHGDLNVGNVLVREDSKLVFIDLSYAVWSFPFFDIIFSGFEEADEAEAYLELWSAYESMDRLKELFELTQEFGIFFGSLRQYHMFKYTEQNALDCARERHIIPISQWLEED